MIGTTFDLVVTDEPAGTVFGLMLLGATPINPAFNLALIGMPTCELHQTLDAVVIFMINGSGGSVSWPVPNNPTLAAVTVYAQAGTVTPGINDFGVATSNGLTLTVGIN